MPKWSREYFYRGNILPKDRVAKWGKHLKNVMLTIRECCHKPTKPVLQAGRISYSCNVPRVFDVTRMPTNHYQCKLAHLRQ